MQIPDTFFSSDMNSFVLMSRLQLNRKSANRKLFYDLVRPRQQVQRNRCADLLRRFEIDHQLELRWRIWL
jgi:hypothetical protein